MKTKHALYLGAAAVAIAVVWAGSAIELSAQQAASAAVAIDSDDIGGVVTGPNGPEAGIWVIAETADLPTRYAKSVVTDDQGRYVVPDLPNAKYKVWVRGYGLVDSPKVDGALGQSVNLRAVPAPNATAAAQYYPANYWYSMLKIPDASQPSTPGPASRASGRTAPSRATTPGSISTTRSGSATTCRCRPPTSTTAWSRSRTAR